MATNSTVAQYRNLFKLHLFPQQNSSIEDYQRRVLDKKTKKDLCDQKVVTKDQCVKMI